MPNPPRKWIAALLGVLAQPLSMLYVGQARWAGIYFLLALSIVFTGERYLRGSGVDGMLALILAAVCAIHAYRAAANYPEGRSRPAYSRWYGLLGTLAAFLLLVFVLRAYLFEPFRAASGSMQPAIPIQAYLIVQKWGYGNYGAYGIRLPGGTISAPLKRGDVVVFEFPTDRTIQYVKRLVGLPGDTVAYQDKELAINGTPLSRHQVADHLDRRTAIRTPAYLEALDGTEYTVLISKDTPPPSARPSPSRGNAPTRPRASPAGFPTAITSCWATTATPAMTAGSSASSRPITSSARSCASFRSCRLEPPRRHPPPWCLP